MAVFGVRGDTLERLSKPRVAACDLLCHGVPRRKIMAAVGNGIVGEVISSIPCGIR